MAGWHYMDAASQQQGPIETDALVALLQSGAIHWDTLVWREGMGQWAPLRTFSAELPVPPPLPDTPTAASPGRTGVVVQAGFWRRWAALFIDQLILGLGFYALVFVLILAAWAGGWADAEALSGDEPSPGLVLAYLGLLLLYYVAAGTYCTLWESSSHQATPGKRAVGIKVVDLQGRRLTRRHAAVRWLAAGVSYLTVYIGFLMAAFTERKQALHDLLAGTLVVDRWAYTDAPERQQQGPGGCAIAAIAGLLLMIVVGVLGILAAIAIPAYQSYTQRAGLAAVVVQTEPWRERARAHFNASGDCADSEAAGIAEAGGQRMPAHVAEAKAGAFQDGGCGLEVTLGGFNNDRLDGHRLWWQAGTGGDWACTSDIDQNLLPAACRP